MDQLAVHVERRPGGRKPTRSDAATTLSERVKNTIGVTVTTSVMAPDSIERSVGQDAPHRRPPATLTSPGGTRSGTGCPSPSR
jgi:AMP-binding enzyme C-terminal domain